MDEERKIGEIGGGAAPQAAEAPDGGVSAAEEGKAAGGAGEGAQQEALLEETAAETVEETAANSAPEASPEREAPALTPRQQRRQDKEEKARIAREAKAERERAAQEEKEQRQRLRQEERQEKRNRRALVRQERKKELGTLVHTAVFVMLAAFIWLAIDQVGLYGFLFVWLFVGLMAASVAVLLVGLFCALRKKRCGILIAAALVGILLCAAWFIFLISSRGLGLKPVA